MEGAADRALGHATSGSWHPYTLVARLGRRRRRGLGACASPDAGDRGRLGVHRALLKQIVLSIFPHVTQDTLANSCGDVLATMLGWGLARAVRTRACTAPSTTTRDHVRHLRPPCTILGGRAQPRRSYASTSCARRSSTITTATTSRRAGDSDAEFDKLLRELDGLERAHPTLLTADSPTQRVGGAPSRAVRAGEALPRLLSLDNAFDDAELVAWRDRVVKGLGREPSYVCEPKIDGVSLAVVYERGS